ncbi:hypothetical protein ANAPH1_00629 [Anaplasma phagocytophilum]|nr:hypothetical protein ANAPH1_00629 [Anaplasma phagocytophilum]
MGYTVPMKRDHPCVQMGMSIGKLVSEKRDEQIGRKLVYDV